jgi:hypothetical protein
MRGTFLVFLALVLAVPAHGEPAPSAEVWKPVRAFIGSWTGARSGPDGSGKVTRQVESATDNRQLVVLERPQGRAEAYSWGAIAYDAAQGALVIRPHGDAAGIGASELVLEAVDPEATRLVFASPAGSPRPTRLTYERVGWNEFVERLEESPSGGPFALVWETRFKRGAPKIAYKAPRDLLDRSASR